MNGTAEYIMAIDLGSSKIVAGLGRKDEGGILRILALKQMPSDSEIRRGIVHNLEDVAGTVRKLKEDLSHSQTPPLVVNHVYVGVNGYTMRTKEVHLVSQMSGLETFNELAQDELTDQVQENLPEEFNTIEVFTQEFLVDGKVDRNPIGTTPKQVDAYFKVVGGNQDITRKTEAVFQNLKLSSRISLGPVASAEAVLNPEEKVKGVVCIDFGAETTSVCVYKGDLLRYVAVLPFGGRNITNDLLQLNMDEEDAENLKLLKGAALHYTEYESLESEEPYSKEDQEVNEIVVARIEEIVENLWAQINRCGVEPVKLLAGIVITGGASRLPDLEKLLSRKTGMFVRVGDPSLYLEPTSASIFGKPELARCIGLLLLGKDGCHAVATEREPVVEEVKPVSAVQEQSLFTEEESPNPVPAPVKTPKPPKPPKPSKPKKQKSDSLKKFFGGITEFLNNEN